MSSEDVIKYDTSKVSMFIGDILGRLDIIENVERTLLTWEYDKLFQA